MAGQAAFARLPDPFSFAFSSRIRLIALLSVVRPEGFDRQRGRFFVRSFRGSRRRRSRFPDTASFGYNLASSPRLQCSRLRSTTKQLTPLRLREDFSASVRCGEIAFGRMQKHVGHFVKECLVRELRYWIDRDLAATREPLTVSVRLVEGDPLNAKRLSARSASHSGIVTGPSSLPWV